MPVLAVVCAALAPVTGASADASCPDPRPCIVVTWTGTSAGSQVVTVDDLAAWADLTSPPYRTRVVAGTDAQDEPRPGQALSIRHLLGQLSPPIAPASVTFTEAPHRGSAPSTLSTADLGDPADPGYPFQDGLMPALFVVGANDAIGYIRPLRGDSDTNGDDFWQTDSGGALQLTVHTSGRLLTPSLQAARSTAAPGEPDAFTATVPDDPGTALTYTWAYGDGATDSTHAATASHTYSTTGTYLATVMVRGADGSYGQSPAVRITVGPRPSASPTTGPPGTGASPDPHAPSTGPRHGNGHHGGAAASAGPTGRPTGPSAPARPATSAPSPRPSIAPPAPASSPPPPQPAADGQGDEVTGVLLAASGGTAGPAPAAPDRAPAARRGRDDTTGPDPALAGIPAALLLLAAGAAGEGRWLRRRRGSGKPGAA